ADAAGRLTAMATADLLEDAALPERMERFVAVCLRCLARLDAIEARDFERRRAGRRQGVEARLESALHGLSALSGGGAEVAAPVDPSNALAAALRHACRAAGID
ncbi:MAG: hypothetical protein HQL39_10785, partial [Alphaproteobacteria bacterium]|nr:hypothetical protein [Alphaproteobacteria bacterium]